MNKSQLDNTVLQILQQNIRLSTVWRETEIQRNKNALRLWNSTSKVLLSYLNTIPTFWNQSFSFSIRCKAYRQPVYKFDLFYYYSHYCIIIFWFSSERYTHQVQNRLLFTMIIIKTHSLNDDNDGNLRWSVFIIIFFVHDAFPHTISDELLTIPSVCSLTDQQSPFKLCATSITTSTHWLRNQEWVEIIFECQWIKSTQRNIISARSITRPILSATSVKIHGFKVFFHIWKNGNKS